MVGSTGTVVREVTVPDVKQRGSQSVVEGEHTEVVHEACLVVAELPENKVRVVVWGAGGGVGEPRVVSLDEFTAAV
jgi:hypothetical protein